MKNPDWLREEIILALDLYFNLDYGQMHGKNKEVIALSDDLKKMNLHKRISDPQSFRSVNSVALKLNNIKKLDQNFGGKGMRDGGKLEQDIWKEFYRHRGTLKKEAWMIRLTYFSPEIPQINQIDNNLAKGIHKHRETDPIILKQKLKYVEENSDFLSCEICRLQPTALYGRLGDKLMEIHYNKIIDLELGSIPISIDDFLVVCPNCHAILDKYYNQIQASDLKTSLLNS